jgi:hypothetical protein
MSANNCNENHGCKQSEIIRRLEIDVAVTKSNMAEVKGEISEMKNSINEINNNAKRILSTLFIMSLGGLGTLIYFLITR